MSRYPTHKNGLAKTVQEVGYEVVEQERRKTNRHHLYFTRSRYNEEPIHSMFRNLVDHVQTMWIPDHDELHQIYDEPPKPPTGLMVDVLDEYLALNGVINCVYESKTNQTRQVDAEMWERIRSYGKVTQLS